MEAKEKRQINLVTNPLFNFTLSMFEEQEANKEINQIEEIGKHTVLRDTDEVELISELPDLSIKDKVKQASVENIRQAKEKLELEIALDRPEIKQEKKLERDMSEVEIWENLKETEIEEIASGDWISSEWLRNVGIAGMSAFIHGGRNMVKGIVEQFGIDMETKESREAVDDLMNMAFTKSKSPKEYARDLLAFMEDDPLAQTDEFMATIYPFISTMFASGSNPNIESVVQENLSQRTGYNMLRFATEITTRITRDSLLTRGFGGGYHTFLSIQSAGWGMQQKNTAENIRSLTGDFNIDPNLVMQIASLANFATGAASTVLGNKILSSVATKVNALPSIAKEGIQLAKGGVEAGVSEGLQTEIENKMYQKTGNEVLERPVGWETFGMPFMISVLLGLKSKSGAYFFKNTDAAGDIKVESIEPVVKEGVSIKNNVDLRPYRTQQDETSNAFTRMVAEDITDIYNTDGKKINIEEFNNSIKLDTEEGVKITANQAKNWISAFAEGKNKKSLGSAFKIGESIRIFEGIDKKHSKGIDVPSQRIAASTKAKEIKKTAKSNSREATHDLFRSMASEDNIYRVYESAADDLTPFIPRSRNKNKTLPSIDKTKDLYDGNIEANIAGKQGAIANKLKEAGFDDAQISLIRHYHQDMLGKLRDTASKGKLTIKDIEGAAKESGDEFYNVSKEIDNAHTAKIMYDSLDQIMKAGGKSLDTNTKSVMKNTGGEKKKIGDNEYWTLSDKNLAKSAEPIYRVINKFQTNIDALMNVARPFKDIDKMDIDNIRERYYDKLENLGVKGSKLETMRNSLELGGNTLAFKDIASEMSYLSMGIPHIQKYADDLFYKTQDAGSIENAWNSTKNSIVEDINYAIAKNNINMKSVRKFVDEIDILKQTFPEKDISQADIQRVAETYGLDTEGQKFAFKLVNTLASVDEGVAALNADGVKSITNGSYIEYIRPHISGIKFNNMPDTYIGNTYFPFRISETGKIKIGESIDVDPESVMVNPNKRRVPTAEIRLNDNNRANALEEIDSYLFRAGNSMVYKPVENALNNLSLSIYGGTISRESYPVDGKKKLTNMLSKSVENRKGKSRSADMLSTGYDILKSVRTQKPKLSEESASIPKKIDDFMGYTGDKLTGYMLSYFTNMPFHLANIAQSAFTGVHVMGVPMALKTTAKVPARFIKDSFKTAAKGQDAVKNSLSNWNESKDPIANKSIQSFFKKNTSKSVSRTYGLDDAGVAIKEADGGILGNIKKVVPKMFKNLHNFLGMSHVSSQVIAIEAASSKLSSAFKKSQKPYGDAVKNIDSFFKEIGLSTFPVPVQNKIKDIALDVLANPTEAKYQELNNVYTENFAKMTTLQYEQVHDMLYQKKARKTEFSKSVGLLSRFTSFAGKNSQNVKSLISSAQQGNRKPLLDALLFSGLSALTYAVSSTLPDELSGAKRFVRNYTWGRTQPLSTLSGVLNRGIHDPSGILGATAELIVDTSTGNFKTIGNLANMPGRSVKTMFDLALMIPLSIYGIAEGMEGVLDANLDEAMNNIESEVRDNKEALEQIPLDGIGNEAIEMEADMSNIDAYIKGSNLQ